jgi:predicted DNA-binding transcriptional regulator YafY
MTSENTRTVRRLKNSNRNEPKDAILRQWVMLQMIPREPSGITAQQLRQKLAQADPLYDVHKRTIERNLMQLMGIFPSLDYRENSCGNQWFWEKDTVLDVPRLDAKTALMFRLAKDYLTPLLPKATLNELDPHFKHAERTLREVGEKSYTNWPNKVRFIQNSIQLKHPEIKQDILGTVYDALFKDLKIAARYRVRSGEEKNYRISLLGLVFRDGVIYAVSALEGRENVRQLPLHRMVCAELTDDASEQIPSFNLDQYVKTYFDYPLRELHGNMDHRDNIPETIMVTLAMNPISAVHLRESPLSEDQTIRILPDGREAFTATVNNTERLRWWILSYGPYMEVLGPNALRSEIRSKLNAAFKFYGE